MTDTKKITDTASIPALIEAAEARASCKLGMAAARKRFAIILDKADAEALRIKPRLILEVEARKGTVDLSYIWEGGIAYSISDEPGEPDRQALTVAHARRSPVFAALDLLRQDLERHAERAEEVAEEAFTGVDEDVTLNGSDYDWDADEAVSTYCGDDNVPVIASVMAADILRPRLAKAQAAHLAELAENA